MLPFTKYVIGKRMVTTHMFKPWWIMWLCVFHDLFIGNFLLQLTSISFFLFVYIDFIIISFYEFLKSHLEDPMPFLGGTREHPLSLPSIAKFKIKKIFYFECHVTNLKVCHFYYFLKMALVVIVK